MLYRNCYAATTNATDDTDMMLMSLISLPLYQKKVPKITQLYLTKDRALWPRDDRMYLSYKYDE